MKTYPPMTRLMKEQLAAVYSSKACNPALFKFVFGTYKAPVRFSKSTNYYDWTGRA
jgi:hypothetical protein